MVVIDNCGRWTTAACLVYGTWEFESPYGISARSSSAVSRFNWVKLNLEAKRRFTATAAKKTGCANWSIDLAACSVRSVVLNFTDPVIAIFLLR